MKGLGMKLEIAILAFGALLVCLREPGSSSKLRKLSFHLLSNNFIHIQLSCREIGERT